MIHSINFDMGSSALCSLLDKQEPTVAVTRSDHHPDRCCAAQPAARPISVDGLLQRSRDALDVPQSNGCGWKGKKKERIGCVNVPVNGSVPARSARMRLI